MTMGGGSKDEVEAGLPSDVWALVCINNLSHSKWTFKGHLSCLIFHSPTKEMSCHLARAVCPWQTLRWPPLDPKTEVPWDIWSTLCMQSMREGGYSDASVSTGLPRKFQWRPSAVQGNLSHPTGSRARRLKKLRTQLRQWAHLVVKAHDSLKSRVKHPFRKCEEESGRVRVTVHRRCGISAGTWLSSKNKQMWGRVLNVFMNEKPAGPCLEALVLMELCYMASQKSPRETCLLVFIPLSNAIPWYLVTPF